MALYFTCSGSASYKPHTFSWILGALNFFFIHLVRWIVMMHWINMIERMGDDRIPRVACQLTQYLIYFNSIFFLLVVLKLYIELVESSLT
ncbi:hypothetical protein BDC45DRAFT_520764 [Circinella umbellata]|nr:hypothetical protein BDC45DRAFT_520764 [Circinella umbellata]